MTPDILWLIPDFALPSWASWRVVKAVLDGAPVSPEGFDLFKQCTGRETLPCAPVREAFLVIGRRGGKSRFCAALAVEAALLRDWSSRLAPGEWATIAIIAADRPQARNVLQYVDGILDACPPLAAQVVRRSADAIDFASRTRIEVTTCTARGTRGYTFATVICDEVAYWRSETSVEPDVEVLQAIRPGLATLDGRLIAISSPYARRGALWEAFRAHFGRDDSPVLTWVAPTATMNPSLPARVIAAAYEQDAVSAAAEYGSEFRSDVSAFVSREVVEACVVPHRQAQPPQLATTYIAYVDPSGGSMDSFTLTIAHAVPEAGRVVVVVDQALERVPPFSPDDVVREYAAVCRQYRIGAVTGDAYAGQWPRERFAAHGMGYEVAPMGKSDCYRELLPLLHAGAVRLLDLPRLVAQLCGLDRRVGRGGKDSIDHAPRAHDDVANATAGAVVLAAQQGVDDPARPWAVNVAPEKRSRVLDDHEMLLMARDDW